MKRPRPRPGSRAAQALVTTAIALGLAPALGGRCAAAIAPGDSVAAVSWRSAATASLDPAFLGPALGSPHHGRLETVAFGGHAEIRAAQDRVAGIENPDWISVPRVSGFVLWRAHPRIELAGEATYDRVTDDLVLERGLVDARIGDRWYAHAGIIQPPLGRVNLDHDAPRGDFDGLSYVATEIIGVPNPQLGLGVHGVAGRNRGALWIYELDAVSGYDEGVITRGPSGTRLPMGRDNFGTGGSWALASRIAVRPADETELGLSGLGGAYNPLQLDGRTVDPSHGIGLLVADGRGRCLGFRLSTEVATAWVDVPGGLEGLYAERQWAASSEVARTLRQPLLGAWPSTALAAAVRADAVDYDAQIPGDSKARISASLNLRQVPWSVFRSGWYYEWRRDRFNNVKPAAGLVFSFATYL